MRIYKFRTIFYLLPLIICACINQSNDGGKLISQPEVESPSLITFTVMDTIKHDTTAFTQGFIVYNGDLLEGTGQRGKTQLRKIDTVAGDSEILYSAYDQDIFGEGITVLKNKLYQLTYLNHVAYIFDIKNLNQPEKTLKWPKEGWGCTTDTSSIIISDGSSSLFFVDPGTFNIEREINVRDNLGAVDNLNELEYINGYIYANRWHSNTIYKIDPGTGLVVGLMHFDGMIQRYRSDFVNDGENVLNGLAWDAKNETLFVTGKNWPIIFKVKFNESVK